jgi:hypothetical protein
LVKRRFRVAHRQNRCEAVQQAQRLHQRIDPQGQYTMANKEPNLPNV